MDDNRRQDAGENLANNNRFSVQIDDQVFDLSTPEPTGRGLLALVNRRPEDFFLVFLVPDRPDLIVELDEPFDLRGRGTEKLVLVSKARRFSIQIDERTHTVAQQFISGEEILRLADKCPETHFVTQVIVGADDVVIAADDKVDLGQPGRERFTIVARICEVIVNSRPKRVDSDVLTFDQIVALAFNTSADNPTTAYTVAYWNGIPSQPEGTVAAGGSVKVHCGMVFSVKRTDKS